MINRGGKVYRYTIKRQTEGLLFSGLRGAFVGMISAGLAELLEYRLAVRCRVPTPVAVATTIFVVVITVLAASIGHAVSFAQTADPVALRKVGLIVMYTIPGVIVGGQIGPVVQRWADKKTMKYIIAGLFVVVGVIMLLTVII